MNSANLARLLGDWRCEQSPGVSAALGSRLSLLIRDGRLPFGTRLPTEREFARELGVSRTTVAGVYDLLRSSGQLESKQGSGTWVVSRGTHRDLEDPAPWYPGGSRRNLDLTQAALPAPSDVLPNLIERAARESERYTGGHGYHLFGLPELREAIARRFTTRGLPTHPGQVLVTTGAQNALALALAITLHPGSRVLTDHPTYPNALSAIRNWGGRCVPVDLEETGWNSEAWNKAAHHARPDLLYCMADFHNPTGLVMPHDVRGQLVEVARLCGSPLLVDEALVETALGDEVPLPVGCFAGEGSVVISIGSLSKIFWGGLRVGWMRAPEATVAKAAAFKASMDMATPVFDQLMAVGVFDELAALIKLRRKALRTARDELFSAVAATLPEWRASLPDGGLSAWFDLGIPLASRLAEACGRAGVAITPGSLFGVDGSFEDHIRLPFTLDALALTMAVERIADIWTTVRSGAIDSERLPPTIAV